MKRGAFREKSPRSPAPGTVADGSLSSADRALNMFRFDSYMLLVAPGGPGVRAQLREAFEREGAATLAWRALFRLTTPAPSLNGRAELIWAHSCSLCAYSSQGHRPRVFDSK